MMSVMAEVEISASFGKNKKSSPDITAYPVLIIYKKLRLVLVSEGK